MKRPGHLRRVNGSLLKIAAPLLSWGIRLRVRNVFSCYGVLHNLYPKSTCAKKKAILARYCLSNECQLKCLLN